jgi:hypothetical protein
VDEVAAGRVGAASATPTDGAEHDELVASMDAQLAELYADRERLGEALGVTSADDIIELVRSMAAQLDALYAELDEDRRGA